MAIAGIGNNISALVQGVYYYRPVKHIVEVLAEQVKPGHSGYRRRSETGSSRRIKGL